MSEQMEGYVVTAFAWCVLVPLGCLALGTLCVVDFIGGFFYANDN